MVAYTHDEARNFWCPFAMVQTRRVPEAAGEMPAFNRWSGGGQVGTDQASMCLGVMCSQWRWMGRIADTAERLIRWPNRDYSKDNDDPGHWLDTPPEGENPVGWEKIPWTHEHGWDEDDYHPRFTWRETQQAASRRFMKAQALRKGYCGRAPRPEVE